MNETIYLDYNATTPIAPEVAEAMLPFLHKYFGNPSSSHAFGVITKNAVEQARSKVATLLGCQPSEIVFTSGGTESNNFALRGIAFANQWRGRHIITSAVEHPAVTEVCKWLATQGFEITILPVDEFGMVDSKDLKNSISNNTILVSIMHANNEVGTLQPIRELAEIAHEFGAIFHSDAAQSIGKIATNVGELKIDLLSIAGHKLYAPKGVGGLYIRDGVELPNLMFGAGHENGRRPGTENVLQIVGLGQACELAQRDLDNIRVQFQTGRDRLHQGLMHEIGGENVRLNGHPDKRLPNTLSLSFRNIAANKLLAAVGDQVAASAGSACHADQVKVSGVLEAMQIPLEWAMGTIRFSVGRGTTEAQIDRAIHTVSKAVIQLQNPGFTAKY